MDMAWLGKLYSGMSWHFGCADGGGVARRSSMSVPCFHVGDCGREQWAREWNADVLPSALPWPANMRNAVLPNISLQVLRAAALTFPVGTGLGWDKLHPRALLRCSDEALLALLRFLMLVEILGAWPEVI